MDDRQELAKIKEYLINNDTLFNLYLRDNNELNNEEIRFTIGESFMHQLFSPEASTSDQPLNSEAPISLEDFQSLGINRTVDFGDGKQCPICYRVFKRYHVHKNRRKEFQCCICWENFGSDKNGFITHFYLFSDKKKCCCCNSHGKIHPGYKTREGLSKHAVNCFTKMKRKNKIMNKSTKNQSKRGKQKKK